MTYPGNPSLTADVQQRILTTYRQSVQSAARGSRDEALLGCDFVRGWEGRIMNIHPSLLPAFPGLNAQVQAWRHGVRVTGATVHLVDQELGVGLHRVITRAHGAPCRLHAGILLRPGDSSIQ